METPMLTKEQAQLLCDTYDVYSLFEDDEELELLTDNNPELLIAYGALLAIAQQTHTDGTPCFYKS